MSSDGRVLDVVLDMETGDPDDALTLCILATHPRINLRAVTVFPGGRHQVGLVRHLLRRLGKDVPIGAGTPKKPDANHVSEFHYKWLGRVDPEDADYPAAELLGTTDFSSACLVTGAPLTNVFCGFKAWRTLGHDRPFFSKWVCQGGFVGENLMPQERVLPKFKGRQTCATWNLNGDVQAALALLDPRANFPLRYMVPKSVCHGVFYTPESQAGLPDGAHAGLDLLKEGMAAYFKGRAEGKALHDIIAAACAIDPSIGTWVEVEPYRERGEWGSRSPQAGPSIYALTELRPDFLRVLF